MTCWMIMPMMMILTMMIITFMMMRIFLSDLLKLVPRTVFVVDMERDERDERSVTLAVCWRMGSCIPSSPPTQYSPPHDERSAETSQSRGAAGTRPPRQAP